MTQFLLILGPGIHKNVKLCSTRAQLPQDIIEDLKMVAVHLWFRKFRV